LRQLEEFIHEEARLAPSRLEVEDFYQDVQQLNQRVDRLQARIRQLAAKRQPEVD
jgi:ubiquinone biosynthesis protein UbiJ